MQAKEWNVPPWDLVCPESKGHDCWLIWMSQAKALIAHAQRVVQMRQNEQASIKRATGQR